MVNWISRLFGRDEDYALDETMQIQANTVTPPAEEWGDWGGDKYHGGFGPTQIYTMDYWTLRERSGQLFRDNLYARGLIRRLVTNEINTGLELESQPDESIIGVPEDSLSDWSELNENKFSIWAKSPKLCDIQERRTFGQIQREIRAESLISGDVLVVMHLNKRTNLPQIEVINGGHVQSPTGELGLKDGVVIDHGVELDAQKRQIAYWVTQEDGTSKRIDAYGPRSGRRVAWLVYGTDKRHDDVRGEPLLSIILQSLKEVDRYRDAAMRKATLNSIIAFFIKKTQDKPGTKPVTGGAIRRSQVTTDTTETNRRFDLTEHLPGTYFETLQQGEEPVPHSTAGTDINFGPFEESIIQAIAWINEIPPEILRLAFSNNYSASQAAINEFKMYLNMIRTRFGDEVCQPVYVEWLISQVLTGGVVANGFLEAWRNPAKWELLGAWVSSDWSGAIKPSTDIVKQAKGYQMLIAEGWITNDRAARELTGTKFSKNIKRLARENEMKLKAAEVLAKLEQQIGPERAAAILHNGFIGISAEDAMIEEETKA